MSRREPPQLPTYICPNLLGVGERLYVTQARKALGRAQLPNLKSFRDQLFTGMEEWQDEAIELDFQAMLYDKFPDYCYQCLDHHSGFVTSGVCLKCITAQVYKPGMIDLNTN